MRRPCRKHEWGEVLLNVVHCRKCPTRISVARLGQLQRAAHQARIARLIRKRASGR